MKKIRRVLFALKFDCGRILHLKAEDKWDLIDIVEAYRIKYGSSVHVVRGSIRISDTIELVSERHTIRIIKEGKAA